MLIILRVGKKEREGFPQKAQKKNADYRRISASIYG